MKSSYRLLVTCVVLCLWAFSCKHSSRSETILAGKALAEKHCSGCHLVPDPSLLDKATWTNGVLPAMAEQLGIEVLEGNVYLHNKQSALSSADWARLTTYYETLAPEMLSDTEKITPIEDWSIFSVHKPKADSLIVSSTLLVDIDSSKNRIYTSDLENPGIYQYDHLSRKQLFTKLQSSAIDICFPSPGQSDMVITCMGGMRALDVTKGQIFTLSQQGNNKLRLISDDLTRPIQTLPLDFNKDGLRDYLVCAFGHNRGGLYILKQRKNHIFEKVVIREIPGATDSIIRDFNGDGWPDIMTLFAHGDEGIWLFLNDQKGGFTTKSLLRFPSVFGSSSFQFADVTHDGEPDIIYTAGDNSDFSRVLKPYHGLYIFEGKGDFQFKQKFFYPIHGCTKAIASDFDKDGDLDIATIAFFADFDQHPKETFLYFEHEKSPSQIAFKIHALPIYKDGRWICMNVQDYDGDGDEDIVLGNFSKGFLNQENIKPTWDVHLPYVLLENKTLRSKLP